MLNSVIYTLLGDSCKEIGNIHLDKETTKQFKQKRIVPQPVLDHRLPARLKDFPAHFTEFAVFCCERVHLDAESARTDHVRGEFRGDFTTLDRLALRDHPFEIPVKVFRAF